MHLHMGNCCILYEVVEYVVGWVGDGFSIVYSHVS